MQNHLSRSLKESLRTSPYRTFLIQGKHRVDVLLGKGKRLFARPARPQLKEGQIYLHLGCGTVNHPSFVNIDGVPAPHIHYVHGLVRLPMFRDNQVDLIYASHCLEHFSHLETVKILKEWLRILKPRGILRLSVPDFNLLLNIYQDHESELMTILHPLMGGQRHPYDFHKTVFTADRLRQLLQEAGFQTVRTWQPGACDLTTFDDWSGRPITIQGKDYPVSLNLEAVK